MKTNQWSAAWGGIAAAGLLVEAFALASGRVDGTLSHTLRRVLATRTARRAAFVAWATFAAWLPWHLHD